MHEQMWRMHASLILVVCVRPVGGRQGGRQAVGSVVGVGSLHYQVCDTDCLWSV